MLKKLILALAIAFLFYTPIHAQYTATFSTEIDKKTEIQQRIEERKQLLETKREEIRNKIQIRKATVSAKLQEKRKVRIRQYFNNMVSRLDAVINRLEKLISRIEGRLEKIEGQDEEIDTSLVHGDLEEAKALLDQAKADLEAAKAELETFLDADDPKSAFQAIRSTIKDVTKNLKEVHNILVHVIGDIKGLRIGQD